MTKTEREKYLAVLATVSPETVEKYMIQRGWKLKESTTNFNVFEKRLAALMAGTWMPRNMKYSDYPNVMLRELSTVEGDDDVPIRVIVGALGWMEKQKSK